MAKSVQYWKKHKKDGVWYMYEHEGKVPKIEETVEPQTEHGVYLHTLRFKGVQFKFTTRCGYDRGPGRQKKLDEFFKTVKSL